MMTKDEKLTVTHLAEKIGYGRHFGLAHAWRVLCPKQHPMPTHSGEAWIARTLRHA